MKDHPLTAEQVQFLRTTRNRPCGLPCSGYWGRMSDYIEHEGKTYFAAEYLRLANANTRRAKATEARLRKALEALLEDYEGVEDSLPPETLSRGNRGFEEPDESCFFAPAKFAPAEAVETRTEWRVGNEGDWIHVTGSKSDARDVLARWRPSVPSWLESRTVTATPWKRTEPKA